MKMVRFSVAFDPKRVVFVNPELVTLVTNTWVLAASGIPAFAAEDESTIYLAGGEGWDVQGSPATVAETLGAS